MSQGDASHMAYIARTVCCGNMVAATVDRPEHKRENARYVGQWMRAGLTIEHVEADVVRTATWGCTCKQKTN